MFNTTGDSKDEQLVLTVSQDMREQLHLKPGDLLEIEVPSRERRQRRFATGQLVREHAEILPDLDDNREWIDTKPVGRELL